MTTAESSASPSGKSITEHELEQTGRTPVVFVHGLWLLPSSWDRWAALFEEHGYVALTPGWPDDPETVEEAVEHPECSPASRSGRWPTTSRRSSAAWSSSRRLASNHDAALEDAMSLPTIDQARSWRGLTLVATDNEPVGRIEAIYVDRTTRQPEWALVHTGLFGSARTFVPLADAAQQGDIVRVPHEPSVVREAPRLEQDAELSEDLEARLYAHYGIEHATNKPTSDLPAGATSSATARTDATTTELPPSTRLEADVPAAGTVPGTGQTATRPAAGTSWSEATTGADADGPEGGWGGKAAAGGLSAAAGSTRAARTATRKAVQASQQAAASGRMAAHKAGQEVAAVVAAIETTPESKRKARKRARARKRALAAAAGAAQSVAAALAAAWRRVRKSDAG